MFPDFSLLNFSGSLKTRVKLNFVQVLFVLIFLMINDLQAQWVNNPAENTKIAVGSEDPVNISAVSDQNGGAFLFWEDNKTGFQNDVYFLHIDEEGFITSGNKETAVSFMSSYKSKPVSAQSLPNTAAVLWENYSDGNTGNLFLQRVNREGKLLWNNGVQVSGAVDVNEYALASDKNGNMFVSFIFKDSTGFYNLVLKKVSAEGKHLFKEEGINIHRSKNWISSPSLSVNKNGCAVLWLESINSRIILSANYTDNSGVLKWGKKPVIISNQKQSVITYSVGNIESNYFTAWQTLKERELFHQLINEKGKFLLTAGGVKSSSESGLKTNPAVTADDSSFFLSWTNHIENDKDIYIKKFKKNGDTYWKNEIPAIKIFGEQFGQKLIPDNNGGVLAAWIDRRNQTVRGNIYAQRLNYDGSYDWDTGGLPVGSNFNSEKSYLSVITDSKDGAIILFREHRENKKEIYAQKVYFTGTFASQLLGFNTELIGDSVKISWYCANENPGTTYEIYRAQHSYSDNEWNHLNTFHSEDKSSAKYYEFKDVPDITGTLYYRLIQKNSNGKTHSEIAKVNYLKSSSEIIVAQNSPNPFSDSTMISFYLPYSSTVSVEFFNSRLEKINEFAETEYPAGENKITFHSNGLKPGIYFYRIKFKDFVEVKKMVVIN